MWRILFGTPKPPSDKRDKDLRCKKRPGDPETQDVDPVVGGASFAARDAEVIWSIDPGAAADDKFAAIAAFDPRRAIRRRIFVIAVDAIFSPLKDIADHIIETQPVRSERADRRSLAFVPLAAAAIAVGVVLADVVAPGIRRRRSSARCVFVFRFGQQPIGLAGDLRDPSHVLLRVVPTDFDHRLLSAAPTLIVRPITVAAAA